MFKRSLIALSALFCLSGLTALNVDARDLFPATSISMSQSPWWDGVNEWMETNLFKPGLAPFSFVYDGKPSKELLKGWDFTQTKKPLDENRTQHILTYVDKKTGLEVRCEAIVFKDHPAVEWVLTFRNTEDRETPIIADIQALDTTLTDQNNEYSLHHPSGAGEGATAQAQDFGPRSRPLPTNSKLKLSPLHGRSSWGEALPFFNIEMSNQGVIVGIGWTGQWFANFTRDSNSLKVRAGMEKTHLKLYPGEEIRTPRMLLLFWQGHRIYGQNLLRRIILAHYWPRDENGNPTNLMFSGGVKGVSEKDAIESARAWAKFGLEYLWIDAHWWDKSGPVTHIGPPDPKRFPNGFSPVSDALKKMGMGLLLWFAPEVPENGLGFYGIDTSKHPEWLLKIPHDNKSLFNFSDENARRWMTDHISDMIQKEGISVFRQDGPYGAEFEWKQPLLWWREQDKPERQGITEIRYIEGLYAFWDELVKKNPGLFIDLCGGGATRLDLEVLSRCTILHRSDYQYGESTGQQSQAYGISLWVPAANTGAGVRLSAAQSIYGFRSAFHNGVSLSGQLVPSLESGDDPPPMPRIIEEFKRIRHLFYGDFYPLTSYSVADDTWIAYQFHKEDLRQGMILAFRRPECITQTANLKLWGLSSDASYEVHFEDSGVKRTFTSKKLGDGFDVTIEDQPGSLLITYRQLP